MIQTILPGGLQGIETVFEVNALLNMDEKDNLFISQKSAEWKKRFEGM